VTPRTPQAGGLRATAARPGQPDPGEPLPGEAFDSHCHLDLLEVPAADALAQARAVGVTRVITVGVDLESSRWSAQCAQTSPDVYAAVAIHPNDTGAVPVAEKEAVLEEIARLAGQPWVRAVGETGLDYYRDQARPEAQRDWFRAHIAIAKQSGKALMIHDREAHEDVLRILDEEGPPGKVVFHCFSGDAQMAKRCAAAGYVLSFAGNITFKNAQPLRDAAVAAPPDALLAETDAPFLTPVPGRGQPNSPAMVARTLRFLAELKQIPVEDLCALVNATGERVFGPW
jgi:TatD DNase family protein